MSHTERPDDTVDTGEVLEEPEAQSDSARPTENSEDLAEEVVKEQTSQLPHGE